MNILYIAKHGQANADDEGAIAHAFVELGHTVVSIPESYDTQKMIELSNGSDLVLFHKWDDVDTLQRLQCKKAYWYFDLVDWPDDPTVAGRCRARRNWMERITPLVDLGFCTDGDHVAKDQTGKLHVLRQGADGRIVGRGEPWKEAHGMRNNILFTGDPRGGAKRLSFHKEMTSVFGGRYVNIRSGCYREDLKRVIASTDIAVAPDAPVTNNYWSNRVYNTLGFGGFLLHPYCAELAKEYKQSDEIVFYTNREQLRDWIEFYTNRPDVRQAMSEAGLQRTIAQHLYKHRCQDLLRIVKEKLGVG